MYIWVCGYKYRYLHKCVRVYKISMCLCVFIVTHTHIETHIHLRKLEVKWKFFLFVSHNDERKQEFSLIVLLRIDVFQTLI